MTHTQPQPHSSAILDTTKYSDYLIYNAKSILQLLHTLMDKKVLLSIFVNEGQSFVSAILSLDEKSKLLMLDISHDNTLNEKALRAPSLTAVTRLEGIRIQFALQHCGTGQFENSTTLVCEMPENILRLQRRECYRLPTPVNDPVTCTIMAEHPDTHEALPLNYQAMDISSGGIALLRSPAHPLLPLNKLFENSSITLPEFGTLPVQLKVRNHFELDLYNDIRNTRIGCSFESISNKLDSSVQRYIFKIERERRASS